VIPSGTQLAKVSAGADVLLTTAHVRLALLAAAVLPVPAAADPISIGWPQPGGRGTDVVITYSYSNLLDGTLLLLSNSQLRGATAEAMRLWAAHAPLHFIEQPDSGPHVSDIPYPGQGHPVLRIGHHETEDLAHAFFPDVMDGRAGDIHMSSGIPWRFEGGQWNFLEVMTHELGHTLGLTHERNEPAVMNPFFSQPKFGPLGTGFLLPADIRALQALYGPGRGSVRDLDLDIVPEPGTFVLVCAGLGALARQRFRQRRGIVGRRKAGRSSQPFTF